MKRSVCNSGVNKKTVRSVIPHLVLHLHIIHAQTPSSVRILYFVYTALHRKSSECPTGGERFGIVPAILSALGSSSRMTRSLVCESLVRLYACRQRLLSSGGVADCFVLVGRVRCHGQLSPFVATRHVRISQGGTLIKGARVIYRTAPRAT
jgi:hypothetical protein